MSRPIAERRAELAERARQLAEDREGARAVYFSIGYRAALADAAAHEREIIRIANTLEHYASADRQARQVATDKR